MAEIKILHTSDDFSMFAWHSLLISWFTRNAQLEDLHLIAQHERQLIREYANGISVISVLEKFKITTAPSEAMRDEVVRMHHEFSTGVLGSAVVIQLPGLAGTVARTFSTGANLLARAATPQKVFSSRSEACAWLAQLPQQNDVLQQTAKLVATLDDVSTRLGKTKPAAL